MLERDRAVISPSADRPFPIVLARAEGSTLWDLDGNRYLDFAAGIAVMALGWKNPQVVAAMERQMQLLTHGAFYDFCTEPPVAFAEKLVTLLHGGLDRVFLANSGAESIEAAVKLARHHSGRKYFIGFYGGFHGRTMGALSFTAGKVVQRSRFGPFLPVIHIPYPNPYRPFGGDPRGCGDAVLGFLEDTVLKKEVDPGEVAGILVEPMQGEGGYIVPPRGFLAGLRRLCDDHGILLIDDEIQSGCFRTGRFLAIEHDGVAPDIVCLAKAIGGGLPLGAMVARSDIMDWPPGSHASTFGGNNLSCAAGLAVLEQVAQPGFGPMVTEKGEYLQRRLAALADPYETIGEVRGRGMMIGMEFVQDRTGREPAPVVRNTVVRSACAHGLILLPAGESVIRFCPPLVMPREDIDAALGILDTVLAECCGGV
jgi:4-aminobutyrate aminotransferase